MGTPSGSAGGFTAPAAKGSLMLGKAKARLRAGMEYGNMSGTVDASNSVTMSREGSYDMGEAEAAAAAVGAATGTLTSRVGSQHLTGRNGGEKGRIFAKSEEITAVLHEGLPLDVVKSLGIDGKSTYAQPEWMQH